jgi:hypothetical protein
MTPLPVGESNSVGSTSEMPKSGSDRAGALRAVALPLQHEEPDRENRHHDVPKQETHGP